MEWGRSGIVHEFSYFLVDPFELDFTIRQLQTVEPGGSITYAYRGDYRYSATINIDGEEIPQNAMVRIFHQARLGDEVYNEELGTFMIDSPDFEYARGRYTGKLSLQSTLMRLGRDKRPNSVGVNAGTSATGQFNTVVLNSGGRPMVYPHLRDRAFSSSHIWEAGESVLTECNRCADACGGHINVDSHGHVILENYQLPSMRAVSGQLFSGLSLYGVTVTNPEITNRVGVTYKKDDVEYFADAKVDLAHPWHRSRLGYWSIHNETLSSIEEVSEIDKHISTLERIRDDEGDLSDYQQNDLREAVQAINDLRGTGYSVTDAVHKGTNPPIQQIVDESRGWQINLINSRLQAKAKELLASKSATQRSYKTTRLYQPMHTGEVYECWYQDSPNDPGLFFKGLVSQIEIDLTPDMSMQLIIEELSEWT